MRFLAIIACGLCLGACTTPHKTYKPPSSARVDATTKRVEEGVAVARKKAREIKVHIEEAQKSDDKVSVIEISVEQKLDAIIATAAPEQKSALLEVRAELTNMQTERATLRGFLNNSWDKLGQLDTHIDGVEGEVRQLKNDQTDYYSKAQLLANDATNEREGKILVEKQLIKQRVWGWIWKIGGGAVIILVIVLVIAWWTGKIGLKIWKP